MINDLDYADIECPVSKNDYSRIEQKTMFALMYFVMKMIWSVLLMYQMQNLRIVQIYYW